MFRSLQWMAFICALCAGVAAHAADVARGAQLYNVHCVTCHGRTGISIMPGAPNLARSEGLLHPDVMIMQSLKRGKGAMPAFVGILKDQEMLDVIAYTRTFRQ